MAFGLPAAVALAVGLTADVVPAGAAHRLPDPGGVHIYIENKTNREISTFFAPRDKADIKLLLAPGDKMDVSGATNGNWDLSGTVQWCGRQPTLVSGCEHHRKIHIKWQNPDIGYPRMAVVETGTHHDVTIRFDLGETHTWYPYGDGGELKIWAGRGQDEPNRTKVWRVTFENK